jgi:hypothetical protein
MKRKNITESHMIKALKVEKAGMIFVSICTSAEKRKYLLEGSN